MMINIMKAVIANELPTTGKTKVLN